MWTNYEEMKKCLYNEEDRSIYLFGASTLGGKAKKLLETTYGTVIEAFLDNDVKKQQDGFEGCRVISPDSLKDKALRGLILICSNKRESIERQLVENGCTQYVFYTEQMVRFIAGYEGKMQTDYRTAAEKAIAWIVSHETAEHGIAYGSTRTEPYPEVTGYIVPTLLQYGHCELAERCIEWLITIQQDDGGFCGARGSRKYVFDTAQILRGLNAAYRNDIRKEQVKYALQKACAYLYSRMQEEGRGGYIPEYRPEENIPETILLYTLAPFREAAGHLQCHEYEQAIQNCMEYYLNHPRFCDVKDLTHFVAYQTEAMIELSRTECIKSVLNYYGNIFHEQGMIPAHEGDEWACMPGAAQFAKCWYLLDDAETAEQVIEWLENYQTETGGFLGSVGIGATYFPAEELSWAVKYYLDANWLRIKWHFNDAAQERIEEFPETVEKGDPRYQTLISRMPKGKKKVLEVGCGKGRFLRRLKEDYPEYELAGLDLSEEMLECLPEGVGAVWGVMEKLPVESESQDVIFCIEALEHSVSKEKAIAEMSRALKKGGRLLIIDKNMKYWGMVQCPAWEKWLENAETLKNMNKYLVKVESFPIPRKGLPDDYMMLWYGEKGE